MQTIFAVWNEGSGLTAQSEAIEKGLTALARHYVVRRARIKDVLACDVFCEQLAKEKAVLLVAIGGDGTVNACAHASVRSGVRLAVIPAGTFNHFAKHQGIPLAVDEAFACIETGHTAEVDTATINERTFVNFVSIGFYAEVIRGREYRQNSGGSKWVSFLKALVHTIRRHSTLNVSFSAEGVPIDRRTPLVFLGNGPFTFGSLDMLAGRSDVHSGSIHLSILKNYGALRLIITGLTALFVDVSHRLGFTTVMLEQVTVSLKGRRSIPVVVDGELMNEIEPPFNVVAKPRSLRLVLPNDAR